KPITATPETPLREAVELMSEHRVGSIVVVEPESGKPLGIFTLRDLLHKVAARDCDMDRLIVSVMNDGGLLMLNWRGTAYQAAILMARHGVHHVIVVDSAGRLAGVVSQSDILDVERGGAKAISGAIRSARDTETLVAVAGEIRRMGEQMLAEGAAAEPLTQLISTLNDHLTLRLIELTMQDFRLPKVEWCWLAFGSEGRFEQTFSTDQDNGIIFRAPAEEAAAVREAFLPFALAVNEKLDACGFTLCKGNIMASNPELCLSIDEWRGRFGGWLQAASPEALLNATIFFDFRPLYGAEDLADELRSWLLARTAGGNSSLFLRFMAENAVKAAPPLGVIRDFVFDKNEEFPHTIDLKAFGSRPFVDAARILALAHGVGETGTTQRLRAVAETAKLGREDIHAIIDGFFFIQQLRLRVQRAGDAAGSANRVDPDKLNELDRHVLKEAFKQARKIQGRLQLDYRL
ncbi:MAG: CBS domain-containing protein, partial [Rhodocyclaceae bacterium]|nr:CBS domain-containing protein [Rhodocyclaceae bacterium]